LAWAPGPHADAQYLFSEDVLAHTVGHRPRHAKTYRNFAAEYERLQRERIAAYREFISDVQTGAYPEQQHVVPVGDEELSAFKASLGL
jgi:3-methyl-2-oxobutanoate hydroxymethyltransferase